MSEEEMKIEWKKILLRIPDEWIPAIDTACRVRAKDRTDFIREAVYEKMARHGIKTATAKE